MIVLKPNSRFRQYKVVDGIYCRVIKHAVRSSADLQQFIHPSAHVYESVNCFLNPSRISGKLGSYNVASRIMLESWCFVDVDYSGERGFRSIMLADDVMRHHHDYERWNLVYSGRGFHAYYKFTGKLQEDPLVRLEDHVKRMRYLENEMINAGVELDAGKMTDPYRVSRVVGSINPKTGMRCVILGGADVFPASREAMTVSSKIPAESPIRNKDSRQIMRMVCSTVTGCRDSHIVQAVTNTEIKMPTGYNLGNYAVLSWAGRLYYVFLGIKSSSRVLKVLRALKSFNTSKFLRYKHTNVPTGRSLPTGARPVVVARGVDGFCKQISRPHFNWLTKQYNNIVPNLDGLQLVGSETPIVRTGLFNGVPT